MNVSNKKIAVTKPNEIKKIPKKRGRKPKGGKIINVNDTDSVVQKRPQNIILHLKCSGNDITDNNMISCVNYDPSIENVKNYQFAKNPKNPIFNAVRLEGEDSNDDDTGNENDKVNKDSVRQQSREQVVNKNQNFVWEKLRELAYNLHVNNISDRRASCFWCTYEFDNPSIHIPKLKLNGTYQCYGCFCSPACACGYLFKENIDSATRFERYHMLNHIYCKIYDYEKNIKPAPNPFYTLDRFYGNLTIQEYRNMMNKEQFLLVIDKPLTRILPELHEDNDEHILCNRKLSSSNNFSLKTRQNISKAELLVENFNLK